MISDLGAICRYLQALSKLVLRRSPPKTEVPCRGVIASLSGASSIRNQWPLLLTFPKPLGNHLLWSQPAKSRPFLWNKATWRRLSSGKGPYLHHCFGIPLPVFSYLMPGRCWGQRSPTRCESVWRCPCPCETTLRTRRPDTYDQLGSRRKRAPIHLKEAGRTVRRMSLGPFRSGMAGRSAHASHRLQPFAEDRTQGACRQAPCAVCL